MHIYVMSLCTRILLYTSTDAYIYNGRIERADSNTTHTLKYVHALNNSFAYLHGLYISNFSITTMAMQLESLFNNKLSSSCILLFA